MYFNDLAGLLHMDGHGPYVWSAYLLTAALLVYNAAAPGARLRRLRQAALWQTQRAGGVTGSAGTATGSAGSEGAVGAEALGAAGATRRSADTPSSEAPPDVPSA